MPISPLKQHQSPVAPWSVPGPIAPRLVVSGLALNRPPPPLGYCVRAPRRRSGRVGSQTSSHFRPDRYRLVIGVEAGTNDCPTSGSAGDCAASLKRSSSRLPCPCQGQSEPGQDATAEWGDVGELQSKLSTGPRSGIVGPLTAGWARPGERRGSLCVKQQGLATSRRGR